MISSMTDWFTSALDEAIASFGPKTPLRDAIEYALKGGGKRFRPKIIAQIAQALGGKGDVKNAALAAEFFHTASLIADDLPCMDDADERRDQPSLHCAFGEATALLASYALIAAGYDRLRMAFPQTLDAALRVATKTLGILGLTGGQFLDLNVLHPKEEEVEEVIARKTGALFELAFVLGWLAGGGAVESLDEVSSLSHHFGFAFQIADDLDDYDEDRELGRINYAVSVGKAAARERLDQEISDVKALLKKLGLRAPGLLELVETLETKL